MDSTLLLVLFDGDCAFCSGWVRFLAARDVKNRLRFLARDDEAAAKLLQSKKISAELDSIMVLREGELFVESDAVLVLADALPFPWTLLRVGVFVPRLLRDLLYRFVARHRHSLPGAAPSCAIDDLHVRARMYTAAHRPVDDGFFAE